MQNYFDTTDKPLLTVDFDYFRIPRQKWELMLLRVGQMGANALALTVPWGFHEANQGSIDLNGATGPRHDLVGLLKLCAAFEYRCILKPGFYSERGILADGLPVWLLPHTDEFDTILAERGESWYKTVGKTLTGYQWPDGPIVAVYLHTEIESSTYSKQLTEVKWRIWLRKRYEGIEELNSAYGTDYRTVNDVKFPTEWSESETALEKDAKEFLEKVRSDAQTRYAQIWVEAGWEVPIYPASRELHPELPQIVSVSLLDERISWPEQPGQILNLKHPVEIDPDPPEIGCGPVWATQAPIRRDGSLRAKFWQIRRYLWPYPLPDIELGDTLQLSFEAGGLITNNGEAPIEILLPPKIKPALYRLRQTGELREDDTLTVSRRKLKGIYRADQTDLLFFLHKPKTPLPDFLRSYLKMLLLAQAQTLQRGAKLAEVLVQTLTMPLEEAGRPAEPEPSPPTTYMIEEARRGLQEADLALRKAMHSIRGLEAGFATILGAENQEKLAHVPPSEPILRPEFFEESTREILIEIGEVCTHIIPQLNSAISDLNRTIETESLTAADYQQGYATAIEAAQTAREPLLELIARLRLEIAREKLPLLTWQIHDQVQEIVESLRWGIRRK